MSLKVVSALSRGVSGFNDSTIHTTFDFGDFFGRIIFGHVLSHFEQISDKNFGQMVDCKVDTT